ncbi:TPA: RidA family protein [Pseudomonas putida]|uniref:RidA family protein n=1 Tax=Pseudomonas putida TaxID=303 RepID=UPI002364179D|nr:RidA family protein [Pseudomonas putida]MDD2008326.1 RidA family protein [Pseudomonas putida]HDS1775791.1 RidA family protein [Pseudomonas putida]
MNDITRIATDKRRSRAVVYNGIVFVGGQTADDRSQDIRGQTQQTLAKIEGFLAEAGTDKSRLLTAQIWIKDIKHDFAGMNEIWEAWTTPHAAPTRATAQCEMASPDILVEIIVTAAVGNEVA